MKPTEAEEHLRVIRSLMERATVYRAISAPTALVAGVLALGVGAALHFRSAAWDSGIQGVSAIRENVVFILVWAVVLLLSAAGNTWFLAHEARQRGEKLISPGLKKALGALFPAMLAGAVCTLPLAVGDTFRILPIVWMIFYGLALLAAAQFSPQAIPRLGWAFLLTGLACVVLLFGPLGLAPRILGSPHLLMALTFGGLHLLYAICTWSTQRQDAVAHV